MSAWTPEQEQQLKADHLAKRPKRCPTCPNGQIRVQEDDVVGPGPKTGETSLICMTCGAMLSYER